RRAALWLAFAVVVVTIVMAVHGIDASQLQRVLGDPRLLAEIAASFVTAVGAALAAFTTPVPRYPRRWLWVPVAALVAWLLLTGAGCAADYARIGPAAFELRLDTACFVPGIVAGAIGAVALVIMLRRGAPVLPRLTLIFAGLALAATVNLGLLI